MRLVAGLRRLAGRAADGRAHPPREQGRPGVRRLGRLPATRSSTFRGRGTAAPASTFRRRAGRAPTTRPRSTCAGRTARASRSRRSPSSTTTRSPTRSSPSSARTPAPAGRRSRRRRRASTASAAWPSATACSRRADRERRQSEGGRGGRLDHCPERRPSRLYLAADPRSPICAPRREQTGRRLLPAGVRRGQLPLLPAPRPIRGAGSRSSSRTPR